jgi:hypothetical protein
VRLDAEDEADGEDVGECEREGEGEAQEPEQQASCQM